MSNPLYLSNNQKKVFANVIQALGQLQSEGPYEIMLVKFNSEALKTVIQSLSSASMLSEILVKIFNIGIEVVSDDMIKTYFDSKEDYQQFLNLH